MLVRTFPGFPLERTIILIVGVVLLVRNSQLLCSDPGNCNRDGCNDTLATAPKECHDHVDEMACFRVCKDPAELLTCFMEREANNTEEYCVLKYSRSLITVHPATTGGGPTGFLTGEHHTIHPGLPCSLKCRADPAFWGCIHSCDGRGCFKAFKTCETLTNITLKIDGANVTQPWCNSSAPYFMLNENCTNCFVDLIIEEVKYHPDCILRYSTTTSSSRNVSAREAALDLLPQCTYTVGKSLLDNQTDPEVVRNSTAAWDDVTDCVLDLNRKPQPANTDDIEKCYRNLLMGRQLENCMKVSYNTECSDPSYRKCQDRCLMTLTKPFCYVPCPRNFGLKACKDDCMIKWPVIMCTCGDPSMSALTAFMLDPVDRLTEYKLRIGPCSTPNYDCFTDAIHDEVKPINTTEWDRDVVRVRNCKSQRHIVEFAKRLAAAKGTGGDFDEDIGLLARHYTFRECFLTDCRKSTEADAQHCMKRCVLKERTDEEMNFVCDSTPSLSTLPSAALLSGKHNFYRAEIVIWCMQEIEANERWSFGKYLAVTGDFQSYASLYECEKSLRENTAGNVTVQNLDFEQIAQIIYEIESDWCRDCIKSANDTNEFHPDELHHAKCELEKCYKNQLSQTCQPLKNTQVVVKAAVPIECYWHMDYSLSPEPYTIWSTYFDEIPPHDETHNMVKPNSLKYLMKSSIGASIGHYVFPYFLIIRPYCESGYYEENLFKFISSGGSPTVQIVYFPTTSRQKYIDLMRATFQGALINLERITTSDKLYIPANPLNRLNKTTNEYDGRTGCHLNLCYPAFLVPQVLLHIPIFEVIVSNQQTINSAHIYGYTTTLHLRDVSGRGSLKIADNKNPPTADEYFPARKVQVYEDTQFVHLWDRLPDSGYVGAQGSPGPELEHLTNHNCFLYSNLTKGAGGNEHFPLDSEDFFQLQLTHGNAPQAIFAGFYDPNLVIIGDPDMRRYELVRWQFEVTGTTNQKVAPLFHRGYPCFSNNFMVRGFVKPMYSLFDRLDPDYWIEFYRMRYAPKDYRNVEEAKAIFGAITLEDRVLFVTTSGIVTFYQNFNSTAGVGKAWEVEPGDRLKKCFKIVRVAKRAHPKGDTIVAVTYDYQVSEKKKDKQGNVIVLPNGKPDWRISEVSQQVWVGTYVGKAEPIKWQEITSGLTAENLKEERVFNVDGDQVGGTEELPEQKLMGIPVERRETNPKSQIEAICYKTYRSNMGKAPYIELLEDQGWCDAIDATPVVAVDQKIQVLVRMKVYYSGGTRSYGKTRPRIVILYVVASFTTDKSASQSSIWQIDSIIPRIPCQDEHRESIPSVVQYNTRYFKTGKPDQVKDDYGCHSILSNQLLENRIYLHGMTYTRSYNHHLFLYGNKLLQSTDGGHTFVQLNSFPERGSEYLCGKGATADDSQRIYHRIKIMAFDDLGHYAFLTNKRELWYGNLGSLTQIRLRPSKAYSMILTRLPEVPELTEAVPFTVFFDSSNELVEMVAVVDANGTVSRIARRSINEKTIMRARNFIEKLTVIENARFDILYAQREQLQQVGAQKDRYFNVELLEPIEFTPLEWSVFCPFASPSFYHNFSGRHGRTQNFFFPFPRQHPGLGNVYTRTTLYTYQAVAFNLIWNSFFNYPYRSYSFAESDPFIMWAKKKDDASVLGQLTYLSNEPEEHGVLVSPDKYRRVKDPESEEKKIYVTYYMDYNVVMKLVIEFSISNDYTLNRIDYLHHHLDGILLNVDNANGSLIQINTEKEILAAKAAVRYVIIVSVKKYTGLAQSYSGRDGIQVPIKLHLIGGFGNCIPTLSGAIHGDSIATIIQVGCPPSVDLVFDWYSTLHSIKFRDMQAHYGKDIEDCYKGEQFCFFSRLPLIPHFHIFDSAKQIHHNFSGKYIMRIIAGGYSRDALDAYTPEEQQSFNIPGVSDVSLIWDEWDLEYHQKIQRGKDYVITSGRNDSREIVLQAGVSAIQWACHTLSPCARVSPRSGLETVYYFKIFITNRGVDNDTLCLFEKEFIVLLYGFPPSPEIQLIMSVAFYILVLTILYIAYFCLRDNKKLWKSTTLKLYGWFQVIKETLPKSWFKADEDVQEETELEAQKRRDGIILTLQGHLNVPTLVAKDTKHVPEEKATSELGEESSKTSIIEKDLALQEKPSVSSFQSGSSDDSKNFVIEPLTTRAPATTWTDLIYEQIISKRLAAILEKNRQKIEESKQTTSQDKK